MVDGGGGGGEVARGCKGRGRVGARVRRAVWEARQVLSAWADDASKVRPAQLGQREGLGPVDRPSCCTHLGQVGRLGDGSEFNPWPANCRARVTSSVTVSPHVASWYRQVAGTGLIGRLGGSFG